MLLPKNKRQAFNGIFKQCCMNNLIALIPAFPFLGFLLLFLIGRQLPKLFIAWIGAGTVCAAAILVLLLGIQFLQAPPADGVYTQTLWQWLSTGHFSCAFRFRIDALSL